MTLRRKLAALPTGALLLLTPTVLLAHPGHGVDGGLLQGMGHPLSGLDHLLAMVTVGLWAAYAGGRAVWALPAAFVTMMLAGAALAFSGVAFPLVEPLILASVVILGLLLALGVRLPVLPGTALVALFGLFHGQAHALEMSVSARALSYAAGFALVTLLLHGAGIVIGQRLSAVRARRLIGVGVASAGLVMVLV